MHHKVEQHVTIKGHVHWELRDPDGRVVQQGEQPNMILNRGLDVMMAQGRIEARGSSNTITAMIGEIRQYFCVGTGSAAPAVTQTTLTTEVHRSQTNGGFTSEITNVWSQPAGVMQLVATHVRVADFTAAFNLTEFGFSDLSSGQICIRELFRDGNGTPITLSVQSGQQLKMTHVITMTVPSVSGGVDQTFDIAGIGTMVGKGTYYATATGLTTDVQFWWNYYLLGAATLVQMTGVNNMDRASYGGSYLNGGGITMTRLGYVAGTYKCVSRAVLATSQMNGAHYGWMICYTNSSNPTIGYKFGLVTPASIVKASTHKLTLDFEVTLGRA